MIYIFICTYIYIYDEPWRTELPRGLYVRHTTLEGIGPSTPGNGETMPLSCEGGPRMLEMSQASCWLMRALALWERRCDSVARHHKSLHTFNRQSIHTHSYLQESLRHLDGGLGVNECVIYTTNDTKPLCISVHSLQKDPNSKGTRGHHQKDLLMFFAILLV